MKTHATDSPPTRGDGLVKPLSNLAVTLSIIGGLHELSEDEKCCLDAQEELWEKDGAPDIEKLRVLLRSPELSDRQRALTSILIGRVLRFVSLKARRP